MSTDELSANLRAGITDALTLIADESLQLKCQLQLPEHSVSGELFNQWEDVFQPEWEEFRRAFSADELEALEQFGRILDDVASQTPQELPPIAVFAASEFGRRLSTAAREALARVSKGSP